MLDKKIVLNGYLEQYLGLISGTIILFTLFFICKRKRRSNIQIDQFSTCTWENLCKTDLFLLFVGFRQLQFCICINMKTCPTTTSLYLNVYFFSVSIFKQIKQTTRRKESVVQGFLLQRQLRPVLAPFFYKKFIYHFSFDFVLKIFE